MRLVLRQGFPELVIQGAHHLMKLVDVLRPSEDLDFAVVMSNTPHPELVLDARRVRFVVNQRLLRFLIPAAAI